MKMKRALIALFVAPMMFLTACGVSTPTDATKIQVGAGPFEAAEFKDCLPPSTKRTTPTNDDYFAYPANERDLDATGQQGSDFSAITVLSKDNAEMSIPITFRFNMVGECETLQAFHKAYGSRYAAYLNDDGTSSEGWMLMLRKLIYDPADATLDEIAKKYTWRQMLNNAEVQNEIQAAIVDDIEDIVSDNAKGTYFENFVVLMKKPVPTDESLRQAVASEQQAVAKAESAEAEARAKKLQAEAEIAVAKAEAAKRRAEIAGYGGFENYNKAKCVEAGCNPYQPTYLYGGSPN